MDIELCQLSRIYADNLSRYYRILKERNLLLKKNTNLITLDVYDQQLVTYGEKIIKARQEFIEDISNRASVIHNDITSGESLEIKYCGNVSANEFITNLRLIEKRIFTIKQHQ